MSGQEPRQLKTAHRARAEKLSALEALRRGVAMMEQLSGPEIIPHCGLLILAVCEVIEGQQAEIDELRRQNSARR